MSKKYLCSCKMAMTNHITCILIISFFLVNGCPVILGAQLSWQSIGLQNRGSWVRVPQPLPKSDCALLTKMVLEIFKVSIYTWLKESKVISIFKFIQQSRQEASKIVWPTRRETITTTVMVFVMVAILATFFLITDSIISFLLRFVLSLSFQICNFIEIKICLSSKQLT